MLFYCRNAIIMYLHENTNYGYNQCDRDTENEPCQCCEYNMFYIIHRIFFNYKKHIFNHIIIKFVSTNLVFWHGWIKQPLDKIVNHIFKQTFRTTINKNFM